MVRWLSGQSIFHPGLVFVQIARPPYLATVIVQLLNELRNGDCVHLFQ